jgi:hypothetical protein
MKEESKTSTFILYACTMNENIVVSTYSKNISHSDLVKECFGSFELNTRGIGSKSMKKMGYNGQELDKKG